jgi:HEAT repeat protein
VPKALATALEDASAETRSDAVAAIGHSGMGVDAFVPALVQHALNDPDQGVRSMCATIFQILDRPKITAASVPHLIKGLDSSEPLTCQFVCEVLARLGPASAPAIRKMRELQQHGPENIRMAATEALAKIQPAK